MEQTKTCRDCGGRMAEGFIVDAAHSGNVVSRWIKGKPIRSWYMGLKANKKNAFEIVAYRCERCGLLQSYVPSI